MTDVDVLADKYPACYKHSIIVISKERLAAGSGSWLLLVKMSDLQKAWAKSKLGLHPEPFDELEEEAENNVGELPESFDDDSSSASSASSVSSTGTIVPTPTQNLFARPQG